MRIAIEESGNFGFPEDGRFESYVLVALIAPDSEMAAISDIAAALRREFHCSELKARKLKPRRLKLIAPRLAELPLSAVVSVFDSHMMDRRFIAEFRLQQMLRIAEVRDQLKRRPNCDEAVLSEIDELMRVIGQPGEPGALSHAEFAQYQALPDLMVAAINRTVGTYAHPDWDADLASLTFVLDRKLPGRLNAGEQYIADQGTRIVGSNARRFPISLPEVWRSRPDHPFLATFGEGREHLSVNRMLADRRHVDSRSDDLLQLADIVAGVVRRAITQPDAKEAPEVHAALDALRPLLVERPGGDTVRVFRLRGARPPGRKRYRAVLEPIPRALPRGPGGAVLLG